MPGIEDFALTLALRSSKIEFCFRKTGIDPFNRYLFTELDCAPAFVIHRRNLENTTEAEVGSTLNANTPEDETPPLSPFLSTDKALAVAKFLQKAINRSPVPKTEQEHV